MTLLKFLFGVIWGFEPKTTLDRVICQMIPARWWCVLCNKGVWPKYKGICAELLLISDLFFLVLSFACVWGICPLLKNVFFCKGNKWTLLHQETQAFTPRFATLPFFFLNILIQSILVLGAACGSNSGSDAVACASGCFRAKVHQSAPEVYSQRAPSLCFAAKDSATLKWIFHVAGSPFLCDRDVVRPGHYKTLCRTWTPERLSSVKCNK